MVETAATVAELLHFPETGAPSTAPAGQVEAGRTVKHLRLPSAWAPTAGSNDVPPAHVPPAGMVLKVPEDGLQAPPGSVTWPGPQVGFVVVLADEHVGLEAVGEPELPAGQL